MFELHIDTDVRSMELNFMGTTVRSGLALALK